MGVRTMPVLEQGNGSLIMVLLKPFLPGERLGSRFSEYLTGQEVTQCLLNFGSFLLFFLCIQQKCGVTAEWFTCPCLISMVSDLWGQLHL
nr:beta-amyrin synthase-like [Ipomoea batatas]GMC93941.1 beta-amyrin synthase-like [Ipomoea batatas]